VYRALADGWDPHQAQTSGVKDQSKTLLSLPLGFHIAPNEADCITVASSYGWDTFAMVLADGSSVATKSYVSKTGKIEATNVLKSEGDKFRPSSGSRGILIRKLVGNDVAIKRHQTASAGGGAVSSAADKKIDTIAGAAALTPHPSQDLLVGASCAECGSSCGATFYWTPAVEAECAEHAGSTSCAALQPPTAQAACICLLCVSKVLLPKSMLDPIIAPATLPFTQSIFQKAVRESLSYLKHCRIVARMGSLAAIETVHVPSNDVLQQDAFSSIDNVHVVMQFITKEVMRVMQNSACDASNLVSWFDEATAAAALALGEVSVSDSDRHIVHSIRFAVVRNALLSSTMNSEAVACQLLPSVLSLCETVLCGTADAASAAVLQSCLLWDMSSITVPIAETQVSIGDCIKCFAQGSLSRILQLYSGLHVSCKNTWDRLSSSKRADTVASCKNRASLAVSGATGPCADKVNGTFFATEELSNGRIVYEKCDDSTLCIHFSPVSKSWLISDISKKGQNIGFASIKHEGDLEAASFLNSWQVATSGKLIDQPAVRVTCVDAPCAAELWHSCISIYTQYTEFIRGVICGELFALLPSASASDMEQALGETNGDVTMASMLPELFNDQPDICRQMASWVARVMLQQADITSFGKCFHEFFLALCGLTSDSQAPTLPQTDAHPVPLALEIVEEDVPLPAPESRVVLVNLPKAQAHMNGLTAVVLSDPKEKSPSGTAMVLPVSQTPRTQRNTIPLQLLVKLDADGQRVRLPKNMCRERSAGDAALTPAAVGGGVDASCSDALNVTRAGDASCEEQRTEGDRVQGPLSRHNAAGCPMKKGRNGAYYCGRRLGVEIIPHSDGQCGPDDGPACPDCKACELVYAETKGTSSPHMQFLQQLHVALFLQGPGEVSVGSWSNGSNIIASCILSHGATFSDSLVVMLNNMRAKAALLALSQISEQSRSCLTESIMDALFSLADALNLTPGRSIDEHAELLSCAEALLPWISVVCGLSFDHAIMSSIVKRVGPFNAHAFESPSILILSCRPLLHKTARAHQVPRRNVEGRCASAASVADGASCR